MTLFHSALCVALVAEFVVHGNARFRGQWECHASVVPPTFQKSFFLKVNLWGTKKGIRLESQSRAKNSWRSDDRLGRLSSSPPLLLRRSNQFFLCSHERLAADETKCGLSHQKSRNLEGGTRNANPPVKIRYYRLRVVDHKTVEVSVLVPSTWQTRIRFDLLVFYETRIVSWTP